MQDSNDDVLYIRNSKFNHNNKREEETKKTENRSKDECKLLFIIYFLFYDKMPPSHFLFKLKIIE